MIEKINNVGFYHEYNAPGKAWVHSDDLPENHKNITLSLLKKNDGIGVMAGYYDQELSIEYVSDLAMYMMGYFSVEDFAAETERSLMKIIQTQLSREELTHYIENEMSQMVYIVLNGQGGKSIVVRATTTTVYSKTGKKMWYVSIKQSKETVIDKLTGANNRAGFILRAEKMKMEGLDMKRYAIVYLNLDNFKAVNELYTIKGGDDLLCSVYHFIRDTEELNPLLVARLESDHFVFIARAADVQSFDFYKIEKIPWEYNGKITNIRARCGIYYIDNPRLPISGMIDRAKLAKKQIDHGHIKAFSVYNQTMRTSYMLKAEVELAYLSAIENKEFQVYYQPVVNAMTGKIVSAEALVRWQHPQKGLISPGVFIPTLEHNGAISKVDEYVSHTVFGFLKSRYLRNEMIVPISINLSWMDFYEDRFMDKLLQYASDEELPSGYMRYELTETSSSALDYHGKEVLDKLGEKGVKSLLDDFGTGYSSFSMIQNFDFDILKLDMSFTRQVETSEKVKSIIKGMVAMCHGMDIKMVAEGAETEAQVKFLQEAKVDYIQGYYFSRPLPEDEFIKYMEESKFNDGL